jgi:hypothetical protein
MKWVLHPWQMLLIILAGWINQQQQNAIEYLIAENRILREKIIQSGTEVGKAEGKIDCRNRLSGILRYYYRKAA